MNKSKTREMNQSEIAIRVTELNIKKMDYEWQLKELRRTITPVIDYTTIERNLIENIEYLTKKLNSETKTYIQQQYDKVFYIIDKDGKVIQLPHMPHQ